MSWSPLVAANPAGPLNCEVDIFRLAVRKKNCLRHKLFSSNDGRYQQREKSQHCFQFLPWVNLSTFPPTAQFQVGPFFLSMFTCFTQLPPSGARSPGGRPAELRKRTRWRAIGPRHIHIYLCTCIYLYVRRVPVTHADHWASHCKTSLHL